MRKNVGTIDASIRITVGLLGLAYGIGKMSRRPYRAPWLLMGLSAMKVAEGFTRFCPMLYAMRGDTRSEEGMESMWGRMVSTGSKMAQSMPMPNMAKMAGAFMQTREPGQTDMSGFTDAGYGQMEAAVQSDANKPTSGQKLSTSDQQLEKEIREHVTGYALGDENERSSRQSSHYSHDEYHYPTYS